MAKGDKDERPARYVEGDKIVYRASSLGNCPRVFVLRHQRHKPAPHPDWFQQVLDEGTTSEPMIDHLWEVKTGVPTIDHQREYDLEVLPGIVIRCHVDGAADYEPGKLLGPIREYKKVREGKDGAGWEAFKRRGPELHTHWLWQDAVIMHATGRELEFVGGRYVVNEETGDGKITEVYCHRLTDPPLPLAALRLKVAQIEKLLAKPTKPTDVECKPRQFPCPYYASGLCGGAAEAEAKAADKVAGATDWSKDAEADVLRACMDLHDKAAEETTQLNARLKVLSAMKKSALEGVQGFLAARGVPEDRVLTIDGRTYEITEVPASEVEAHTRKGYTQMKEVKATKGKKGRKD